MVVGDVDANDTLGADAGEITVLLSSHFCRRDFRQTKPATSSDAMQIITKMVKMTAATFVLTQISLYEFSVKKKKNKNRYQTVKLNIVKCYGTNCKINDNYVQFNVSLSFATEFGNATFRTSVKIKR